MKNIKKLTAIMASLMLAVGAVPVVSGAEILKGDVNNDGVVDSIDADLLLDFIDDRYYSHTASEEDIQYYITYGDMNDDGRVYYDDLLLIGEINSDITLNTELGDVNHDGYVDAIDATAVLLYYADLSIDNYNNYTEAEHQNFLTYGNMTKEELGDDYIDAIDACWILIKYAENATE